MEFTIGQPLYLRFSRTRQPGLLAEAKIEKIGRVWLTLSSGDRVDKKTLGIDSSVYGDSGRAYLSREDYHEQVAVGQAWSDLFEALRMRTGAPQGVTVERIQQARELLGLEEKHV